MIRVLFASFILFLLVVTTGFSQERKPSRPRIELSMKDQFNRQHHLADFRGNVVVLVYGDRQGVEACKALGKKFHVAFHPQAKGKAPTEARKAPVRPIPNWPAGFSVPDVKVIPVACTGSIPGFIRGFVRSRFRAAVPDVPIWLDMDNKMKNKFGQAEGVANVVIFDTQGSYRQRVSGSISHQQFRELESAIEKLRRESKQAR